MSKQKKRFNKYLKTNELVSKITIETIMECKRRLSSDPYFNSMDFGGKTKMFKQ